MARKFTFIFGAALGYVLGSRAGRERYEQIRAVSQRVWNSRPVQAGASAVQSKVDVEVEKLKDFGVELGGKLFAGLAQGRKSSSATAKKSTASTSAASSSSASSSSGSTTARKSKSTARKSTKTASKTAAKSTASKSTAKSGAKTAEKSA